MKRYTFKFHKKKIYCSTEDFKTDSEEKAFDLATEYMVKNGFDEWELVIGSKTVTV
jgi:hypothetical protein